MDQERQGKQRISRSRAAALCVLGIVATLFGSIPAASRADTKKTPAVHLAVLPASGVQAASADVGQHNFGDISLLAPALITETFTLRNGTQMPLVLDHLQPSCGCIAAALAEQDAALSVKQVAPGQSISVKVQLDPAGLEPGPLHKVIWVFVHGQDAPAATLVMVGNLLPAASFSPRVINYGSVEAGTKLSQLLTVTLDPKELPAGAKTRLVSSDPDVEVVPVPASAAPGVTQYQVTLLPNAHLGVLSDRISLQIVSPAGEIDDGAAFVTGQVTGDISALPASLAFGSVPGGDVAQRQLFLVAATQEALTASADSAYVKVQMQLSPSSKEAASRIGERKVLLTATLSSLTPPGPLTTQIVVTTKSGQHLRIPVFVLVEPKSSQP